MKRVEMLLLVLGLVSVGGISIQDLHHLEDVVRNHTEEVSTCIKPMIHLGKFP